MPSVPQAYSEADPRIKSLGHVVKHWAKQRLLNKASEGSLSSYGYLLCLVHFLQTRNPPVVPNLQVTTLSIALAAGSHTRKLYFLVC